MTSFQKDKSLGPDAWTVEFFIGFFDLLGDELLRVVEETRLIRKVLGYFNTTFLAIIPKSDKATPFRDSHPISLCNSVYKIFSKVIIVRLKKVVSKVISAEQFGFLEGRYIHEAIGSAQEVLHSIWQRQLPAVVMKQDLSKAFGQCNWLYLRLLLIHIGFDVQVVNWIMSCVMSVSFAVLINGAASPFFKSGHGL